MSLCISENSVPSSTFWLVAGILFISIMMVFDLATKTKQESDLFTQGANNRFSTNNRDINSLFVKIAELEKKVTDCKKECTVKLKVKTKSGSEQEAESESESGSE